METTIFTKTIKYDRTTRDFAMYLNGELIGYVASYLQAEIEFNSLVHDILTRTAVADASDVADEDVEAILVAGNEPLPTSAAAVANAPSIAIYRELGQTNASSETNGSLVFTPSGMDARFITLKPRDTYELYTFLAKHLLVATIRGRFLNTNILPFVGDGLPLLHLSRTRLRVGLKHQRRSHANSNQAYIA
ncbi:hypothetical protein [Herpetosiphon geysericola]|uniref:Uncharacterized protein n=1 Tax=Herpetosiphon geysericola TaxID=70996 RepID=A0A0P6XJP7_9CHLR|nr:hypothetical protein [Herpetosiphon geysericola]KPL80333.1 hypothetical protein SE18_25160 [Herpetosiphon geysericola]